MSTNFKTRHFSGGITIFITLIIACLFFFFTSLLEAARLICVKSYTNSVSFMALDSGFSHFAKELYDSYGVFGVFSSEEDFQELTESYINTNLPFRTSFSSSLNLFKAHLSYCSLYNVYHLPDYDGIYFAKQAVAYEKYNGLSGVIDSVKKLNKASKQAKQYTPGDVSSDISEISADCKDKIDTMEITPSASSYKNISSKKATDLNQDIFSKIRKLLKKNLLQLFINDTSTLSTKKISSSEVNFLPSIVCLSVEEPKTSDSASTTLPVMSLTDKCLFSAYIKEHFSSYKNTKNKSVPIKYQREYILAGKNDDLSDLSDKDILLSSSMKLLSYRASLNMAHILADEEKRFAINNLSRAICLDTPLVSNLIAFSIMSIWSYAEGIVDVKDLFSQKKVPLIKDDSTWTLSIEDITKINGSIKSKNNGDYGYTYDEYLTMCTLMSNQSEIYMRTLDLIQLDIRTNVNKNFSINSCIIAAELDTEFVVPPLFSSALFKLSHSLYSTDSHHFYGYK